MLLRHLRRPLWQSPISVLSPMNMHVHSHPLRKAVSTRMMSSSGVIDPVVFDVTEQTFAQSVMSSKVPVVLDIHAEWCGPCKTLAPILESAVRAQGGAVTLAKLDADSNSNLVQQLRVTSLPTVLGVHAGKLVDSFTGMQPEEQIKAFVSNLAKMGGAPQDSPVNLARAALDELWQALEKSEAENGLNVQEVMEPLRALMDFQSQEEGEAEAAREVRARATAFMAKVALLAGDKTEAKEIAAKVEADFQDFAEAHGEIRKVLAEVKLAGEGGEDEGEANVFREALEKDAKDAEALLGLARNRVAAGAYEEAVELALKLLRVNRAYEDEAAQKLLIDVFQALGPDHELTRTGRRRMSSLLLV